MGQKQLPSKNHDLPEDSDVFPANAGIQLQRFQLKLLGMARLQAIHWFPACAGMTSMQG